MDTKKCFFIVAVTLSILMFLSSCQGLKKLFCNESKTESHKTKDEVIKDQKAELNQIKFLMDILAERIKEDSTVRDDVKEEIDSLLKKVNEKLDNVKKVLQKEESPSMDERNLKIQLLTNLSDIFRHRFYNNAGQIKLAFQLFAYWIVNYLHGNTSMDTEIVEAFKRIGPDFIMEINKDIALRKWKTLDDIINDLKTDTGD